MKHYWDGRENDGVHIHYRCVICKVQILHNYGRDWSRDLKKMELKVHLHLHFWKAQMLQNYKSFLTFWIWAFLQGGDFSFNCAA